MKARLAPSLFALPLGALVGLAPAVPAQAGQYLNPRYGTTITYPEDVFTERMRPSDSHTLRPHRHAHM